MKKVILSLFMLLLVVFVTKAQTIDWQTTSPGAYSGSYTESINSTSYTFESNILYAKYWLDADGHTMNYDIQVKETPIGVGILSGEFQVFVNSDTEPHPVYLDQNVLWNWPASDPTQTLEPMPTLPYSFSGSFDIGYVQDSLVIYTNVMLWDDADYFNSAGFSVFPLITP